jgi:hypothetical protein
MKHQILVFKAILIIGVFLLSSETLNAQEILIASVKRDSQNILRIIQVKFDDNINSADILDQNVFSLDGGAALSVGKPLSKISPTDIYEIKSDTALQTKLSATGKLVLNAYILAVKLKDSDGKETWKSARIILPDTSVPSVAITKDESEDIEDSNFYIDGELKGANKKKTTFSTNIKVKRLTQTGKWIYSKSPIDSLPIPFYFKLNASTDVEADPDSLEIGFNFARVVGKHFYWDNDIKIESQRDFKNTNFIYSTRGIWRPAGKSLTKKDGNATSILFFRPYIGAEVGKNLRSPVATAQGDGIARILAGADLRLNIPINEDKGQEINWTNSYTRRWLLSDELSFKADDDGVLQLVRFGKRPRDYVKSKIDFSFNKFFGAFIEYDWGQLPPSYKFVDHRFRVGLFYKFKFAVK